MKRSVRTVAVLVGIVVVLVGVILAVNVDGTDPTTTKGRLAGKPAPAFTVETLDGETVTLDDLAGKTVVVNFWNSWCAPCLEEAPALEEFHARHADEPDFEMVGIVRDDTEGAIRDYVESEGVGWTIGFDPGSKSALAYGTTGQPETFVIGPDGVVAGEQYSAATVDDLEIMLRAARGTL